ncbi:neutral cholesterol ester hydrolase 1-like [Patiria miniata]|uniref:Alpha/beta hydrolase fold-3 domain-containing protein n=1 Tax=Patiria miniata TaxID=46514 RepID=A0A913ZIN5_PATMI|nr:neutral cholesterol ester hydrolase 1-like [Patiria miniata]
MLSVNVTTADAVFDGVRVRIFDDDRPSVGATPGETKLRPAVIFFHGGGFMMMNLDAYHGHTAHIARNFQVMLISVEYRLAPKHRFPAAIDDCTAATVWFLEHAHDFNVDPTRVAVMGDSAGGNLAAAVAQRLTFDPKYKSLPKVKLQILIYPMLQAFDFQTPSYQQNGDYTSVIMNRKYTVMAADNYMNGNSSLDSKMSKNLHTSADAKTSPLAQKCLSHDLIPDEFKQTGYEAPSTNLGDESIYNEIKEVLLDPDFAPLMREDLRGLPEAYILTAEYDVLRDDGIMYAKRLEMAGVPVAWKHYRRGFHGMFGALFDSPTEKLGQIDFAEYLKEHL